MPKVYSWEDLIINGVLVGRDLEVYWGGESVARGPIKKVVRDESGRVWITFEWGAHFNLETGTYRYSSDLSEPGFSWLVNTKYPVVEVGEGFLVSGDSGCEILVVYPQGNNLSSEEVEGFPVTQAAI